MTKRRRRTIAGIMLAAACAPFLATAASRAEGATARATRVSLMAGWKVHRASRADAAGDGWTAAGFDDSRWRDATVTDDGNQPYPEAWIFYRRWVEVPAAWKGREVSLVFDAVDDNAVVYVNGRKACENVGWDTRFAIDVSAVARTSRRILVAVLCENTGGPGGIWRPVSLVLPAEEEKAKRAAMATKRAKLSLDRIPHRIVYESFRDGSWDICSVRADGSDRTDLTRTRDVSEMSPHASPDGKRICFVCDEGTGRAKVRSVYYMNLDGSGRTLVARNARQPCWGPDGKTIAYLKGEFDRYTLKDYATKGLFFYDVKTRKHRTHPNQKLHHLYNIAWSPDGRWFVATVHGGMGFGHALIAFEADGTGLWNLGLPGCRPEFSSDGKWLAWTKTDYDIVRVALAFSPTPRRSGKILPIVGIIRYLRVICSNGIGSTAAAYAPRPTTVCLRCRRGSAGRVGRACPSSLHQSPQRPVRP